MPQSPPNREPAQPAPVDLSVDAVLPSLPVNMRGGGLPEPDASGKRFLEVPLDGL